MNTEPNAKPRASKNSSPKPAPVKKAVTRPEKAAAARAKKAAQTETTKKLSPAEQLAAKVKTTKPRVAKVESKPKAPVITEATTVSETAELLTPKAAARKAV